MDLFLWNIKLSQFAGGIMLYVEKAKESTRKLFYLIKKFDKVAVYKINSQKSFLYLYSSN